MQTIRKIGDGFLFGGIIFLLFLLVFQNRVFIPNWLQVIGRMHPMLLHFPIVLLLLSFLTAWLPLKDKNNEGLMLLRLIAALSAVITAIMGLLLSFTEGMSGSTLQWHKWTGVSIALLGFVFYTFPQLFSNRKVFEKCYTLFAAMIIILAGHFGADLTHGENYLVAPVTAEEKLVPVDEAIIFKDVIKPILDKKCASCHGEGSMKGGLILQDTADLLRGGKTGPLFIAGDPDKSLIIHRLLLPEDEKKHMPPITKPALAKDEIALIHAWIKAGAVMNTKLISLPAKDSFRILASRFLAPSDQPLDQPVYDFPAADEKKIAALNNNYRVIEQQGFNSPTLAVHFYGRYAYDKKSMEELLPIKQQIIELSLAKMPVKDEEMQVVKQMVNLQKLNLNYTDITSKALDQLQTLKKLNELTLAGTSISVQSLQQLMSSLPQLASVVIWDTKMDSTQIVSLQNKFKKIHIETGYKDDGQTMIALSAPMIKKPSSVFDNEIAIELKHPFRGVEIRYTLDGSEPDSINGAVYKEPLQLDSSAFLIAKAYKQGWYGSNEVKAFYAKRGFKPDSIQLNTEPNPRYNAKATILSDDDLGDVNFGNGQWMGYHKDDASYTLYFNEPKNVKQVLVGSLTSTGAYIFPPVEVEVYGGKEKGDMKLLGKIKPKTPQKGEEPSLNPYKISFASTEVKCLKVIAKPLTVLPSWLHPPKGERPWVFVSEIVVN
ncbi:MAG: c-type cytochrome domain-containing protein [Ilyomonas sp.]